MIKDLIMKIVSKEDLTYDEAYEAMSSIMKGESTPTQNAAFLAALSTKSATAETVDEIAGCADAMRSLALKVEHNFDVLEIVGTGGDGAGSVNISTMAAIVVSAGGVKVAKHGNRAASSKCGAADCLEALGVNINQDPKKAASLLQKIGICFLFAQKYHTSMKYVGSIRKELGFRTVFNILGPLTNPALPAYELMGVYDGYLLEPLADVLMRSKVKSGMVVYGLDKLDEISVSAPTRVCEFGENGKKVYEICPEDFGMKRYNKNDLTGGTPKENADITRKILKGELKGAKRDAVLLNAGAAFYITKRTETLKAGIDLAKDIIDSGRAYEKLEEFIRESNA